MSLSSLSSFSSIVTTPLVISALLLTPVTAQPIQNTTSTTIDWNLIPPSPNLTWTPCLTTYLCARLTVPLSYVDPSLGTTTLAYLKLPARNETLSTPSIQLNGGGPGVSGIYTLLTAGSSLRSIFSSSYNLIAFDPRGVNNSSPSLSCFPPTNPAGQKWENEFLRVVDEKDPQSIRTYYQNALGYSKWCTETHRNTTAAYSSTPAVAADMLHFARLESQSRGLPAEDAKVWYYGGSYGTVLGATFAALYPQHIGRLILDGVVDTDDYYAGRWTAGSADTNLAFSDFAEKCHRAGERKCAIWAPSPTAIESRAERAIDSVRAAPIPVTNRAVVSVPQLLRIEHVINFIVLQLYSQSSFPALAAGIRSLETRQVDALWVLYQEFLDSGFLRQMDTAFLACLDKDKGESAGGALGLGLETVEQWESYVRETGRVNKWNAGGWLGLAGMCVGREGIRALGSRRVAGPIGANSTSNPILFISNSIDAATAIRGAHKMSSRFPDSVVLEQRVNGHGFFGFPSQCTKAHVRAYLEHAILPAEGTVCEVDVGSPFDVVV
ncbi:hypothetical protein B0J11DRAFT_583950 [Dendryphion nanum]|uniref:Alpha/beta-hydrolase n=1 Tax=Dendryphion nanum TaxID=256645 RepID=A0A9P9DAP5_9PLEO|nr:hypothetical protein B0J11DRAFT_583950 [Dendryphion nanum]